ncbi:MAG: hypothetical protein R3320_05210, partial [Nitriliruptorales bacterium]|nr:hypothetical protein [Nitriliruptorales bacterium]
MSDSPTPDQTDSPSAAPAEETAAGGQQASEPATESAPSQSEATEAQTDATTAAETPEVQQVAGEAAQPTVGTSAGEDVVVMQEPGGSMTSTGDQIVEDDLGDMDFEEALEGTLKSMSEGEIVEGVVVKIDPDEVLLDIGWKS